MGKKTGYYKTLFLISAIWNWLVSIPFFFFYDKIFSALKMLPLDYPVIIKLLMSLVFIFGLGYYWTSKNMSKNIPVIKMGTAGKIFIFLILYYYCVITKDIPIIFITPGIVDLIFAILFIEFLAHADSH